MSHSYYYMHGSLLLWNDTVGEAYPNYERIWRIEPDVFFSGSASTLIELSAGLQVGRATRTRARTHTQTHLTFAPSCRSTSYCLATRGRTSTSAQCV